MARRPAQFRSVCASSTHFRRHRLKHKANGGGGFGEDGIGEEDKDDAIDVDIDDDGADNKENDDNSHRKAFRAPSTWTFPSRFRPASFPLFFSLSLPSLSTLGTSMVISLVLTSTAAPTLPLSLSLAARISSAGQIV